MYLPETICPNLQLAKLIRELNLRKLLYQEHFVVNYSVLVKSFIKRTFLSLIDNNPHLVLPSDYHLITYSCIGNFEISKRK